VDATVDVFAYLTNLSAIKGRSREKGRLGKQFINVLDDGKGLAENLVVMDESWNLSGRIEGPIFWLMLLTAIL
jgi:hypothetical protein